MKILVVLVSIFLVSVVYTQEVINFDVSSCSEKSYPEFIRNRVISKELNSDTLTLRVGLVLNCCIDPDLILTYKDDSLYIEITNVATSICMCECCFELEIKATGIPNTNFQVIYKKEEWKFIDDRIPTYYSYYPLTEHSSKYAFPTPTELENYKDYSGKMNQLTNDGQKFGFWNIKTEKSYYFAHYILDKDGKSQSEWSATYDINGELKMVCGSDGLDEYLCAERMDYYLIFGKDILEKNKKE